MKEFAGIMRQDGTWGDHICLALLSQMLYLDIVVSILGNVLYLILVVW